MRYVPTNLSKRDIANELCVSLATVKTHSDRIYTKLGVRSRGEPVERGPRPRLARPLRAQIEPVGHELSRTPLLD